MFPLSIDKENARSDDYRAISDIITIHKYDGYLRIVEINDCEEKKVKKRSGNGAMACTAGQ